VNSLEVFVSVEGLAQELGFTILERGRGSARLHSGAVSRPGLQFTGYYEYFTPDNVQLIGNAEMYYIYSLAEADLQDRMEHFMGFDIPCLFCSRGLMPPKALLDCARAAGVPVLSSPLGTAETAHAFDSFMQRQLARRILTHGVLMDIYGVGVLLRGESGIGKSETALELIRAGQRLVADDVVEVNRIGDKLIGRAPDATRHMVEVRGIGIVDVRYLYGVGAVLPEKEMDLVIDLENFRGKEAYTRFGGEQEGATIDMLGVQLVRTVIPVSPGRNLAIVVEVAARNFRLKRLGYNPSKEFSLTLQEDENNGRENNGV
jgi:HPr kinase/phosphorylase